MIIRQRPTFADDFLLQTVFPFLDSHDAKFPTKYLMGLARYWNTEFQSIQLTPALATRTNPLAKVRLAFRKVAETVATATNLV